MVNLIRSLLNKFINPKSLLSKLDPLYRKKFYQNAKMFLFTCTSCLQENLPPHVQFYKDAEILHPVNRQRVNGSVMISRLTQ